MTRHTAPVTRAACMIAEQLEQRWLLAVDPLINEFLASNNSINSDENGDTLILTGVSSHRCPPCPI